MRFLDQVAQSREPVVVQDTDGAALWQFPGADVLAAELAACPLRYVLDDAVTAVCTRLAFEDDTILGSSLELVRVPAPKLWIEFVSSARHSVFAGLDRLAPRANPACRQRIGLMVSADARGRAGAIEVCWERDAGQSPDLAPFVIEYDFDDACFSESGAVENNACLGVSVADFPALQNLFNRIRFRLRPEWHEYYAHKAKNPAHYQDILNAAVKPLVEDVPFVALFCLLLASKSALRERPTEQGRLNAARARHGRPPLLDHVELSMNLARGTIESGNHRAGERSSPRLHFVRGHLVRRGDTIFWRTSHMRGMAEVGAIRSRTISLHIGAGKPEEFPVCVVR